MNLAIFKKQPENNQTIERMPSLEVLLRSAMQLGRIEFKNDYGDAIYKMQIMFNSPTGSTIFACGRSSSPEEAISKAIQEAYRLGAK